ncbi:hypothetical protein SAMN05428988_3247 [Chitinophaga sp. YR573]|uniref:hypothetical protein n=1 Tax=Chitinophaga sp. YR573 TaxID=1881040 RepID=UPI0008BE9670|nr:hypothetical protein [Chitinophaga sp. YR573]SEW21766.1 hypothetical protein SAMN05428988_3247 [Chitinophaga sp. YR573]
MKSLSYFYLVNPPYPLKTPKKSTLVDDAAYPRKQRINSKQKGNTYERWVAKQLRDLFAFNYCKTSRQASRLLDNSGIDLSGIPFNASLKTGYRKSRPKPEEIFKNIKEQLIKNFPGDDPIHSRMTFLFHKLDGRAPEHHIVSMMFDDWCRLMAFCIRNKFFET